MGAARKAGVSRDYLAIIDATYRVDLPTEDWLQGIADAGRSALDRGLGVYASLYDASDPSYLRVDGLAPSAGAKIPRETVLAMCEAMSGKVALIKAYYWGGRQVAVLSSISTPAPREMAARREAVGMADAVSIRAANPLHRGLLLVLPDREQIRLPARTLGTLRRLSAHLDSAYRLRKGGGASVDGADAVFSPNGKALHQSELAAPDGQSLSRHVGDLVRARELRRESPEVAVELWKALVAGQWSIFRTVDTDGKHFVIARRNEQKFDDPRPLSAVERPVALYAAWGHSLKLISYELGIAESTVNQRLKSALKKLGLRHRGELAGVFDLPMAEPKARRA